MLSHPDEDMGAMPQASVGVNLLLGVAVYLPCFVFDIGVCDEGRTYLLVAVAEKLFPESRKRVKVCIESRLHFQLVIDEKRHIFVDALPVDHPVGVVLVVGIFKLRTAHRLSVDGHYGRVSLPVCHRGGEQCD